ncbi:MAG: DnaJ domain-containing protein [Candidatus Mariimomonas ferrooxydans]
MENYYEILGVSSDADERTIQKAFHRLAKKYHPDVSSAEDVPEASEKFKLIKEAYDTLKDKGLRKTYDKYVLKKASLLYRSPKVTEKAPYANKAEGYYSRGRKHYSARDFHSAVRAFQTALNLDSDNALYCSWLGLSLSHIPGRLHEAKKWCEKATKLSPLDSDYYVNLAIVFRDAGLKSKADRLFSKALSLDPDNKRIHLWLKEKNKNTSFKDLLKILFGRKKK